MASSDDNTLVTQASGLQLLCGRALLRNNGAIVQTLCDTLRNGAPNHTAASRALGLKRDALFLPLYPDCNGRCGGVRIIGNHIAYYVLARAAAEAGSLNFVFGHRRCSSVQHVLQILPAVVRASVSAGPGAPPPSYANAAAVACEGHPRRLPHQMDSLRGILPRFALELRAELSAWVRRQRFPKKTAPYDEVAIHFRCGDVLKTQHPEYGLASLDAVVALVPKDRRVTVGLVTVPFQYECDSCNAWLAQDRRRRPHQCAGAAEPTLCPCSCAAMLSEFTRGLRLLRPLATVTLRDADGPLGAWARLALAPLSTV